MLQNIVIKYSGDSSTSALLKKAAIVWDTPLMQFQGTSFPVAWNVSVGARAWNTSVSSSIKGVAGVTNGSTELIDRG